MAVTLLLRISKLQLIKLSAATVATTSFTNQTDAKQAQENINIVKTEVQAASGSTNQLVQNQDDDSVKA